MIRWLFLSALSLGVGGQSGAPAQEPTKPDIVVVTGRVEDLRYDELDDVGLNFEVTATLRISRVVSGPAIQTLVMKPSVCGSPFFSATAAAATAPAAEDVRDFPDYVAQIALWGCLLSILGGGAYWGLSQHGGNSYGASKGKMLVLGGAIGAAVYGGAAIIVNTLYGAAQS